MAITKNVLIRYHVLDKCFRNPGRKYYIDDLLEECNKAMIELDPSSSGIGKRQLYVDIRFMESEQGWSIPLERYEDGKRVYMRYSDLNFSIFNQQISEVDVEQLKSALLVLSKFDGIPQFEWVNEITEKLDKALQIGKASNSIISFDNNKYVKGIEYIGELFNAVLYKKVLKITYKSFKSAVALEFIIHPYHIKQYNTRWFVFGWNENFNDISNLALDRIKEIEEIKGNYIESDINFEEYFDDIIGVTFNENEKIETIKLMFTPDLAPYILTKPLHGSQKKKKFDDKGLIIHLELIPNYELERLILSFGERAEVLEPISLKNRIAARLKQNLEIYK